MSTPKYDFFPGDLIRVTYDSWDREIVECMHTIIIKRISPEIYLIFDIATQKYSKIGLFGAKKAYLISRPNE